MLKKGSALLCVSPPKAMNTRKRILIIEDEVIIANHLEKLLANMGHQVFVALDVDSGYSYLKQRVDLALIDMNIDHRTSGLEIAKAIKSQYQIPFIFITANNESSLVLKALDTDPASYLTKPFSSIDVIAAVKLALSKSSSTKPPVQIKDGATVIRFKHHDLMYAITDGNYLSIVTTGKTYLVRSTMDNLFEILDDDRFCRIHRTAMVNITCVESYGSTYVYSGGRKLPLARSRKKEFVEIMKNLNHSGQ